MSDSIQTLRKSELNQKVSNFLSQPNARIFGTSFDAAHLSSFLLNSPYSNPSFSIKPLNNSPISQINSQYQPSYLSNISSNKSYNEKPSFYFLSGDRDKKTNDFPSNYSILSPLVLPNFKNKGKIYELKKLEGARGQRIVKNNYKSGILSVDNPLNENSRIYKKEHEDFLKRQEYLYISKERQAKMIAKYSNTNPNIEFYNKNLHCLQRKPSTNNEKITPYWTRKAHCNEEFINKWSDSHTRVFSVEPEKYNLARAHFLREKDVGKKDYTLISETSNKIEIKPREIIKVLG